MTEPSKEYRARIRVRLSDGILPVPALSKDELRELLTERLNVGDPDAPVVSVSVDDPQDSRGRRRY